jgi:hypothetical protein
MLYAPLYNGLSAALALSMFVSSLYFPVLIISTVFMGNGMRTLLIEFRLDGNYTHFILCALMPLLFCVSLVFTFSPLHTLFTHSSPSSSPCKSYKPLPLLLAPLPSITKIVAIIPLSPLFPTQPSTTPFLISPFRCPSTGKA